MEFTMYKSFFTKKYGCRSTRQRYSDMNQIKKNVRDVPPLGDF